jgi:hypothetical protein
MAPAPLRELARRVWVGRPEGGAVIVAEIAALVDQAGP